MSFRRSRSKTRRFPAFADVCVLECRELLSADLASQFTSILIEPTTTDLENPGDGVFTSEGFVVFGSDDHRPAVQSFGNSSQMFEPITYFGSILSPDGTSSWNEGTITAATILPDNSVLYVGDSDGSFLPDYTFPFDVPTYWFEPDQPQMPSFIDRSPEGWIDDVAENGLFVGGENGRYFAPYYGFPGETYWTQFPGTSNLLQHNARTISRDGQFVVTIWGDIWISDPISGFRPWSKDHLDLSETGLDIPWIQRVEVADDGQVFIAGTWFNLDKLADETSFWNGDGEFLGTVERPENSGGNYFTDFAIVEGEVIAAVNGGDQARLVRPRDMQTVTIESLIGRPANFIWRGLFATDGQLGLLLNDESGSFVTVLETSSESIPLAFQFTANAVVYSKGMFPQPLFPGLTVSGAAPLQGLTLTISASAFGNKKKPIDRYEFPDFETLGTSTGPVYADGKISFQLDLGASATKADLQSFLQGIAFSTKGKGLKQPLRTLTVTLSDNDTLLTEVEQTIQVIR